jgi:sRNA-binding carbon storage regulator CsrA
MQKLQISSKRMKQILGRAHKLNFYYDMEVNMLITTEQLSDSVVCRLPDGREVEIVIVSMSGEDVILESDIPAAVKVLRQYLAQTARLRTA